MATAGLAGTRRQLSCHRQPAGRAAPAPTTLRRVIAGRPLTQTPPTLAGYNRGCLAQDVRRRRTATNAQKQQFSSFEDMIENSDLPLVVDFYATWCGPCQMLSNELSILSEIMEGEVKVVKIDTEKYPSISSRHYVQGLPTVILFHKGEEIHRIEGFMQAAQIADRVRYYLAKHK